MGGNALKNTTTERLPKKHFERLSKDVLDILSIHNITASPTIYYGNKPDFGDLDVLIKSSTVGNDLREIIVHYFNPHEIYHNGNAWSFDYRKFQIDFITVPDDIWETSNIYFSYNDFGNFMGRIAYSMGFRYGDYGLKLNYYYKGRKFSKIVSQEPSKYFEFLGFDWNLYKKGFNSLTDIFDYVINSKYFNAEIFNYENLNHQNKTRNKKRKNYGLFLEYVMENASNKNFQYLTQEDYIKKADDFFNTNLLIDIFLWKKEIRKEIEVAHKFNGDIIMSMFPLKGKELGEAIKRFKGEIAKKWFPPTNDSLEIKSKFNNWIYHTDVVMIWDSFATINNLEKPKL